ncbi:MAG: GNAT family N-acetyltransferase [Enterocloster asparagiformis]|nr:GNAT family N-acetyltransferase [Enterocloster asparagiformis]
MNHSGTVRLETKRLALRPFVQADAPAMYQNWANDPEVTKYLTWTPHKNVQETEAILADWILQYGNPEYYCWAIALKEDEGTVIGNISVVKLEPDVDCVTIGYCLGRRWWGQGLMPEAFAGVIRFFFEVEKAGRIQATHDTRNPNSGKVMEKCGLRREGILRRSGRNCQGICDQCIYGIVAEDYMVSGHETSSPAGSHGHGMIDREE